ncbi:chymotrypsin-1-like, partial [Nylanderia fulva]|uniref:chymotrypsin-1-like n=1 Tax=Nylanderia fulva TaxID=613905 RepID=UPI0010FAFA14
NAGETFADEPSVAIFGGTPAAPGEFPWQCSLNYYGEHRCGCSIIGSTKILTTASCVFNLKLPNNDFFVRTGTIDSIRGDVYFAQNITIHPNFTGKVSGMQDDIAVITLASPIQYNKYQSPIPLGFSLPATGTPTTFSGWGWKGYEDPIYPQTLLKMTQSTISLSECQQTYASKPLTSAHLCAYNRRGIGTCIGDHGGPLIANGRQVGIATSFTYCGADGKPDVYISVPHYFQSFIVKNLI